MSDPADLPTPTQREEWTAQCATWREEYGITHADLCTLGFFWIEGHRAKDFAFWMGNLSGPDADEILDLQDQEAKDPDAPLPAKTVAMQVSSGHQTLNRIQTVTFLRMVGLSRHQAVGTTATIWTGGVTTLHVAEADATFLTALLTGIGLTVRTPGEPKQAPHVPPHVPDEVIDVMLAHVPEPAKPAQTPPSAWRRFVAYFWDMMTVPPPMW